MEQTNSMNKRIKELEAKGFTENFVISHGRLNSSKGIYRPEQVTVEKTVRIENDSDPNNQSILYGLSCEGGEKGMVVNGFGLNSDPDKDEFILKATRQ
mgnify:CR=1 FL=1